RPGRDRPRDLHLDALPAQALRGRGNERLPVDPHDAARALPPGPARSRAQWRDDPDDREPLGPTEPAALQPALPLGLRLPAERAPARAASVRRLTAADAGGSS